MRTLCCVWRTVTTPHRLTRTPHDPVIRGASFVLRRGRIAQPSPYTDAINASIVFNVLKSPHIPWLSVIKLVLWSGPDWPWWPCYALYKAVHLVNPDSCTKEDIRQECSVWFEPIGCYCLVQWNPYNACAIYDIFICYVSKSGWWCQWHCPCNNI